MTKQPACTGNDTHLQLSVRTLTGDVYRLPVSWDAIIADARYSLSKSWKKQLRQIRFLMPDRAEILDDEFLVAKLPAGIILQVLLLPRAELVAGSSDGWALVMSMDDTQDLDEAWQTPLEHSGCVQSTAWAPDGMRLATGAGDSFLRIFSMIPADRNHPIVLQAKLLHFGPVGNVKWSPSGKQLASASQDGYARVFDIATLDLDLVSNQADSSALRFAHPDKVWAVDWSPDGKHLATGCADGLCRIFNIIAHELVQEVVASLHLPHGGWVRSVAWSPDGARVATGAADGLARVFEATHGGEQMALEHAGTVWSVSWSPTGKYLAIGSDDGCHCFDSLSWAEVASFGDVGCVRSVSWNPDSDAVIAACDGCFVRVLCLGGESETRKFKLEGNATCTAWCA